MLLVAFDLFNFDILKFLLAANGKSHLHADSANYFGSCNFLP